MCNMDYTWWIRKNCQPPCRHKRNLGDVMLTKLKESTFVSVRNLEAEVLVRPVTFLLKITRRIWNQALISSHMRSYMMTSPVSPVDTNT